MTIKKMSKEFEDAMQKDYQDALKKAMGKRGVDITFTNNYTYGVEQTSGTTTDGGLWYACWDKSGGHFVTEKDFIPTKVIFNSPATICYFPDGTKTVVKCADDEEFIEEVGVMACIIKKLFESRNKFKKLVKDAYRQPDKKDQWG